MGHSGKPDGKGCPAPRRSPGQRWSPGLGCSEAVWVRQLRTQGSGGLAGLVKPGLGDGFGVGVIDPAIGSRLPHRPAAPSAGGKASGARTPLLFLRMRPAGAAPPLSGAGPGSARPGARARCVTWRRRALKAERGAGAQSSVRTAMARGSRSVSRPAAPPAHARYRDGLGSAGTPGHAALPVPLPHDSLLSAARPLRPRRPRRSRRSPG